MSDRIFVDRIAIYAYHGVHAEEERLGQRFYVSLDCCVDLRVAGENDSWENTICYVQLTELVSRIATGQRFKIIEALAESIELFDLFVVPGELAPDAQVVAAEVVGLGVGRGQHVDGAAALFGDRGVARADGAEHAEGGLHGARELVA